MVDAPLHSSDKDVADLPLEVREALRAVWEGRTGDSVESQTLELKEDPAQHMEKKKADAKIVEILVDESVCLANGEGGEKHLVVGISDKRSGAEAFSGCQRDIPWLRRRIFDRTRPHLTVDAYSFYFHEVRLVWIRIPEALALYTRTDGAAKRRVGKRCEVLNEEQRREISWRRKNPDRTASPANIVLGDLDPLALEAARINLSRKNPAYEPPQTTLALLGELGLLTADGRPTYAAQLLFSPGEASDIRVQHFHRSVPGGTPTVQSFNDPIILVVEKVKNLIRDKSSAEVARVEFPDGQELAIPEFPHDAVDEIVTNAFVHRDWEMQGPIIVEQSPSSLRVISPGPLPEGVNIDRLLSTRSVPRNPLLMAGMRALGLVEQQSRGFDRIWLSLLNSGRRPPQTNSDQLDFTVNMAAGKPDTGFIQAIAEVEKLFGERISGSVYSMLILRHLFDNQLVTKKTAEKLIQADPYAVQETCDWLEGLGIIRDVRGTGWALSEAVARVYGPYTGIPAEQAVDNLDQWIVEKLKAGESVKAGDVANKFGVSRKQVTEVLVGLRSRGLAQIDPEGPQRGRGTRWVRA